ncbi:hypothetical protein TcasGA2_TC002232 [Tribolium castaneum]|uniref:Uncharacterized protein n=1 Tax=Tribolium castaneum TaxID=7070 RepID=D7GY03_TRICA|nr:hypothetical protein TcasGA2_TC002232 [Tribolium castaneum]
MLRARLASQTGGDLLPAPTNPRVALESLLGFPRNSAKNPSIRITAPPTLTPCEPIGCRLRVV